MFLTKDVWFNNFFFTSLFKVFSSTDFYDTCLGWLFFVRLGFYKKKNNQTEFFYKKTETKPTGFSSVF
jgi:hypothetical protein